jgi:hypothetical protein
MSKRGGLSRRQKRIPKGVYANYFEVGQTAFEVVIDFGQRYAGQEFTPCHTRIVTSPIYAKALLETLQEALNSYDASETAERSDKNRRP